jgi:hypothetical protein
MRRALLLAALVLAGDPAPGRSDPTAPPVIVELFTSEGCSSCPPAEALLARLARDGLPGVRVLALSEHVDIWDGLGWADPFASPAFTARQDRYARRLGLSSVYTPQAVVDGVDDVVGSDAGALGAAIRAAARRPRALLAVRPVAGGVTVEGAWTGGRATVRVALVEDGIRSKVLRGENAGRTLEHPGVVRWLAIAGEGHGRFEGTVPLPALPETGALRLVAFAQEGGDGRILAVGALDHVAGR